MDMFPGASQLGDTVQALFSQDKSSSFGSATQGVYQMDRLNSTGVERGVYDPLKNDANRNSPQYGNEKNKPAPTEDPAEVQARWDARLAKFAGIAQGTGVKMGGL